MAFKMKNPGMGKMAKAAGSPHKFGIENKGMDSAARGTKAIGSDGQPLKMKKDFGMEGSAMKFKGIRDKIAARRVSKNKFGMADDPNYKASDKKRISDEVSKGQRDKNSGKQDVAQTGVTKQAKKGKTKEYQVDQDGKVKSLSKVKTRGRKDLVLEDGTIKRRGRKVTKTISADGTKRKVITDSSGKVLKDKTSKRKRKQLDKTVSGRAAELKVKKARKREDFVLDKRSNKKIEDYNEKELAAYNKKIADAEARGLTVRDGGKSSPSKMKKKSAFKAEDEGKVVKTTTLKKDAVTNTETTPGSEKTKPGGSKSFNAAFSKACKSGAKTFMFNGKSYTCETAPEKKTTPSTTKTTTTPEEKETVTLKEKELNKKIRKEGEFNTEKIEKKKKGAGKKKVKDFIRKTFTKKNKGDQFCPTDGPKLGC